MSNSLEVIVLAAGKGTRMKSALPKVLHPIAGKAMVHHVVDTALALNPNTIHLVVGHGAQAVRDSFDTTNWKEKLKAAHCTINFVEQTEQLGTGHAVMQAAPHLSEQGVALILYGDVPLIKQNTLRQVVSATNSGLSLLTQILADPTGYGRIKRNEEKKITAIVEQKDASEPELAIQEINTGVMALACDKLKSWLPKLSNNNAQKEYYLTDLVGLAADDQVGIHAVHPQFAWEPQGVNNRVQQAELERALQTDQANILMADGLYLSDPKRFDLRGALSFGSDCSIDVNCVIEGDVRLGDDVSIGPFCYLKNCTIDSGSNIAAYTSIDDSSLGKHTNVGPYARLRPGTTLADQAKIGNFVETKKARIGKGSKVNHLSYVGDTEMGEEVNVGAGTITCNYDGVNKHKTTIEDDVFIGSNSALVAPLTLKKGATIGAGSTITRTTPENTLTLTRAKQLSLPDWKRPTKK